MVRIGFIKRRTKWISATLALAIVGAVALATSFTREGLAADDELATLLPQLVRTPVHIIDVSFDQSVLGAYKTKLLEIGKESGLSGDARSMTPDLNWVDVELWGKGIFVNSVYRFENSPKNYTIFI